MRDFPSFVRIPSGKLFLKLALSLALLSYLFHQVGLGPLWGSLRQADGFDLLLGLGMVLSGQVMNAFKWKLLLKALGIELPFRLVVRYYFMGTFFNLFLPGLVGGDFVRGYYLVREEKAVSTVAVSILAERLLGLLVLLILVRSFLFLYGLPGDRGESIGQVLSLLLFALLLLWGGMVFGGSALQSIGHRPSADPPGEAGARPSWISRKVQDLASVRPLAILFRLLRELSGFRSHRGLLGVAMLLIFGWQLIFITVHILVGRSLGLGVPSTYYFIFVPLSVLLSALPISFSGLGIRESSYLYFLSLVQVPGAQALSFSLLWFSILFASGLVGGMVYLGSSRPLRSRPHGKEGKEVEEARWTAG